MSTSARGFTLIELLVGLAVGSLALLAAAEIAAIGVRSSGRGEQSTELASRTRLVAQQLRSDLGHAGYGSSGLIGVTTGGWWAGMTGTYVIGNPPFRADAIPAVRGFSNVPAGTALGGTNLQPGSDVIQLVVPDPDPGVGRVQRIAVPIAAGGTSLGALVTPTPPCPFIYIVDHASPNGAGRTQIARHDGAPGNPINLVDPLAFPLPQGTEVLCARVSTYWVDDTAHLHRTDLDANLGYIGFSAGVDLWTSPPPALAADVIAPGVVDLQLAFVFSRAATGSSAAQHTFGNGGYVPPAPRDWAEVRSVRYTLVGRALRQVVNPGPAVEIPVYEDRPPGSLQIASTYATHVVAGGAELTNLRYFDEMADANVVAEPY